MLADHQLSGRGRQGRQWLNTPRSSLLASWLLRPDSAHVGLLPLLTGLAVSRALTEFCGVDVGVKWPNDILSRTLPDSEISPGVGQGASRESSRNERKLAGILAEASSQGSNLTVVVGLGLNLEFTDGLPSEVAEVGVDLATLMKAKPPNSVDLLREILIWVDYFLVRLESGAADEILAEYRKDCVTIGRQVQMHTPGGILEGLAVDIDNSGGLVVQVGSRLETVTAGDTHHV